MSINLRKARVSGLKRCCLFNKSWRKKKVVWRLNMKISHLLIVLTRWLLGTGKTWYKTFFKESFKDQRWAWEKSVRAEKRDRTDWWWCWRRNVSFPLSAVLSLFSALTLFSHAHLWSLKLSLKMRVSSKELFSTLKNKTVCTWQLGCSWSLYAETLYCPHRSELL